MIQWGPSLEISCEGLRQEGSAQRSAYSPISIEHSVQGRNLEMFICGRKGFDDTLRNLYEGLFLGHRLPNNSAYFLWWKIPSSGKSDTCSLDPWQEGHRTVTSKVCQINDPTQDYGSLVSDPRKQRTVCNSS